MVHLDYWWEEGTTAVTVGSEYKMWSPPPMLIFYMDAAALARVQGAKMVHSKPFEVVFGWELWLLFSALLQGSCIRLFEIKAPCSPVLRLLR